MQKTVTVLGVVALMLALTTGGWAAKQLITGKNIRDRTVETRDLANDSVKPRVLADGAVGSAAIKDGAVAAGDLAAGAIGTAQLGESSVGSAQIIDGGVDSSDLADGSVGSFQLASGAVRSANIGLAEVRLTNLATNSVGQSQILTDGVGVAEIATDAVGSSELATSAVATAELAKNAVASDDVAAALLAVLGGLEHDYLGAAAADAFEEEVLGRVPFGGDVTRVTYTPDAPVTGQATDTRRLEVVNKGQEGTGTAVIATIQFDAGVNAAAFNETTLTIDPATDTVAEGDILALRSAQVGAGMALPPGLAHVEVTRP